MLMHGCYLNIQIFNKFIWVIKMFFTNTFSFVDYTLILKYVKLLSRDILSISFCSFIRVRRVSEEHSFPEPTTMRIVSCELLHFLL